MSALLVRECAAVDDRDFKQLPTHTTHMMYLTQTHKNPVSHTSTSLQRLRAQPRSGYRSPEEEMMCGSSGDHTSKAEMHIVLSFP
jgi:hypothetical protein